MGSHDPFWHLKHKLWPKERPGVKLTIWLPTMESRESTQFPYVQVAYDMPLESSWWGLQLHFGPHLDRRSAKEVIVLQSCRSSNLGDFKTPIWEFETKSHLDEGIAQRCRVYYMGEGGGFPWIQVVVNLVSPKLPVARPSTKGAPTLC
jgi:hypothetical protein